MTEAYESAGLTPAEMAHLTELVAAVQSADPTVDWVAVQRTDVTGVVAALDRLVDQRPAGSHLSRFSAGVILTAGSHLTVCGSLPDLVGLLGRIEAQP
jgi:hypothetical protein